jgi:hypothetical protein
MKTALYPRPEHNIVMLEGLGHALESQSSTGCRTCRGRSPLDRIGMVDGRVSCPEPGSETGSQIVCGLGAAGLG